MPAPEISVGRNAERTEQPRNGHEHIFVCFEERIAQECQKALLEMECHLL